MSVKLYTTSDIWNSPNIARAFRWVQFERISKYQKWSKSLIVRAFMWLLVYLLHDCEN